MAANPPKPAGFDPAAPPEKSEHPNPFYDPCDPGLKCNQETPVPLYPLGSASTPKFDDPLNLVLPIERLPGFYAAILAIGYARDADGAGVVPLHFTKIEFARLNVDGSVNFDAEKYVLVDSQIRFFTVMSDGERSLVPPYFGGGMDPFGLVVTSRGAGGLLGQVSIQWRWMPRTSLYPNIRGCE